MKNKFFLELWNPKRNRYETIWVGPESFAMTMFNKSYNRRHSRRLIKVTTTIVAKAKADKD